MRVLITGVTGFVGHYLAEHIADVAPEAEVWGLVSDAEPGEAPPTPPTPIPKPPDDPSWPLIPSQDFSNLPKQQLGLHATGFEYMRLAQGVEGMVSNVERLVDGYLEGVDHDALHRATPKVSGRIGHVDMHPDGFLTDTP